MRKFLGAIFSLAGGIFLLALNPAIAASSQDIQMLPPVDFNNSVCNGANAGILYWDGTTAIKCIPNSSGDASGNVNMNTLGVSGQVSAGTVAISGATQGALDGSSSDTINGLRNLPPCGAGTVLTKTGPNTFQCVSASPALPSCGAGQTITYDNSGQPVCSAPPVANANPLYVASDYYAATGAAGVTTPYATSDAAVAALNSDLGAGLAMAYHDNNPDQTSNVSAVTASSWAACAITDQTSDTQVHNFITNSMCLYQTCYGHFSKYPAFAQAFGNCALNDGSPYCNGGMGGPATFSMGISCEYTQ